MTRILTRRQALNLLASLVLLQSTSAFLQLSPALQVRLRADSTEAVTCRQLDSSLHVATPRRTQKKNKKSNNERAASKDDNKLEVEQIASQPRFVPPTPHDENRGSKFRKLKDMIWIRETVEDLTAAEFACSVEASQQQSKRRRAVDYDKLLAQLNKRLRDLGCGVDDADNSMVVCELEPGLGMGTTVYNDEEREELFE